MGVSFIANIVLARLLTPSDFGVIGMLAIFVSISTTFIDGGFGSALIQKKEPTQSDYSTIFYVNIIISVTLYSLLYVCAPYIAEFYHMDMLSRVLRCLGLILILNAFSIIQANRLRKQLMFRKLSIISLASISISVVVAIVLAYNGYGVWSLVYMQIINSGVNSALLWLCGNWTPSWAFSKESLKQLFGFGSFLLVSNLINTACNNVQGLIIGRMFSPAIMGYYSQARKLEEIPSTSISSIIDKVSYPVMSAHQNNPAQLITIIRKFILVLAFITFPIMILLIILGKPLIVFLYSDKWLPCVPYFQILCIAGIAVALQSINYYAVAATGKSKDLFKWTIIKRGSALAILVGGSFLGIFGLLIGTAVGAWIIYLCNSLLVSRHLGYTFTQQFRDLSPVLLTSLISFLGAYSLTFLPIAPKWLHMLQTLFFVGLYLAIAHHLCPSTWYELKQIITNINKQHDNNI